MPRDDQVPYTPDATRPAKDDINPVASGERAGVYVYCVVPGDRWQNDEAHLDAPGIGDRGDQVRVVRVPTGDVAALVSDSPQGRYAISRHTLMAHERVIELAMASSDVLPLQFGKIAASDQEVKVKLLEAQRQRLLELLGRVRDKVELGLKVRWSPDQLFAEIVAEDGEIQHLRDTYAGRATFSEQLMLGQLVERAIVNKREREVHRILTELQPRAVDIQLNAVTSDMMVLNAAFLVDRMAVDEFDEAVGRLEAHAAASLHFRYVGPLPPYSFVAVS